MPYITNTALTHIPRPPRPGAGKRAKDAVVNSRRLKGARNKAKHMRFNATSAKGKTPGGETIGARQPKVKQEGPSPEGHEMGALTGYVGGATAGSGVGYLAGRKKHPESKKFNQTIAKGGYTRITDVGTAGAKARRLKRWPKLPGKALAGGVVVGGAAGYLGAVGQAKNKAAYVQEQRKTVKKAYEKVKPSYPTGGKNRLAYSNKGAISRVALDTKRNMSYRGPHGKENRKISGRSTAAGAAIGAGAGAGLAHVAMGHSPKSRVGLAFTAGATALGAADGHAVGRMRRGYRGTIRALNDAHARGDVRKPNKGEKVGMNGVIKMDTTSAFGVDHAVSKAAVDPNTGKEPSIGRRVLASTPIAGAVHPFVAGKQGKKLRSAGNQLGGSLLGSIAGSAAGTAATVATRGKFRSAGRIGGLAGAVGGQQAGLNRNQRKGYLKPQS